MGKEFTVADKVLESWGATVTSVPTSATQQSDWLVDLHGCRLLIEEKMKFESAAVELARDEGLKAGEIYGSNITLQHNNRFSGIVKKAASQLASTGMHTPHDFRILWFTGAGHQAQGQQEQMVCTLYGSTNLLVQGTFALRVCYFFGNSDFFRYQADLDGAVVAYLQSETVEMKLCLNPYSPKWELLRDSPFAKLFATGVIDPLADEAIGDAFIMDGDVDRRDIAAVIAYIQDKYNLPGLMEMKLGMASAAVRC